MEGFEAKQLQSIFQSATDAIIISDKQGVIISWNAAAERIFGWASEEIVGKPLSAIMPSQYAPLHQAGMERFNSTGEKHVIGKTVELEGIRKNGEVFPIELSLGHWKDQQENYFCGIIRDITIRKRMEAEIEKATLELEAKVIERTNELIQRNAELEQYVYVVSHDLKEPMRSIAGLVSILDLEKTESNNGTQKCLDLIQDSATRMIKLVDDLLAYSRLGVDRKISSINCSALLQDVLSDLKQVVEESNAKIIQNNLPILNGFQTEMRLLFQNLISNAIKFRRPNLHPIIHIDAYREETQWKFVMEDNGIGIAEENLEKVFIIFKRLHDRNQYEGTGIGLAHCKKIVDLHGGKIWVESIKGEGSKFLFTIPDQRISTAYD